MTADVVLNVEHLCEVELVVFRQHRRLGNGLEQANRNAPAGSELLDRALQAVVHTQLTAHTGRIAVGSIGENRRGRRHHDVLQVCKDRAQRVSKSQ